MKIIVQGCTHGQLDEIYEDLARIEQYEGKFDVLLCCGDFEACRNVDDLECIGELILTEEPYLNSFAQSLAGRIQEECFEFLDAPVFGIGSKDLPAIPLNSTLEKEMIPNTNKVIKKIKEIFSY